MTGWRIHCKVFGPSAEPRWFVVRDYDDGQDVVLNERGHPMPYETEAQAEEKAAQLNDVWRQFDVRR